ncbi:hypothetical protein TCAL_17208 [Tigriopus californicus]|uniref:IMD domain-containing protein n=1 Tax=Tigriopus californicus TaxID=6832 RepID=A0A553N9T0_TIGCA|nr:hypothetical protein TCAL_17208 [Tigriopus californicus]
MTKNLRPSSLATFLSYFVERQKQTSYSYTPGEEVEDKGQVPPSWWETRASSSTWNGLKTHQLFHLEGATREIGACLTRIVIRHKAMETRMKTLCSALLECMVVPLQDKLEEWRKTTSSLDKDHAKEYKKLRAEIKKKSENSQRIQKKNRKNKDPKSQMIVEAAVKDVNKSMKHLSDTEKNAVRRVLMEERSRYCTFVACLKPLLDEEVSLVTEFQQLEEVSKKLSRHTEDPFKLPPASEQVINDLATNSGDSAFTFQTPPSSPSSLGSRKSSMCSISSAGSSNSSSVHHSPSHQSGVQLRHRSLSQAHHNPSSLGPQMMRLSSISSQDSGFTSQDTLFLRPNSPSGRSKGSGGQPNIEDSNILTERPHTISSAYEKGHQRPQLQPYTFQPPCESINENENETDTLSRKPPVPQRCVSLDMQQRPVPKGKKPMNPQILAQIRGTNASLPNFNTSREDMVLPQPVYMNMSDLAVLAAQKAAAQNAQSQIPGTIEEESPDLKTPTAEDLNQIPGQKADRTENRKETLTPSSPQRYTKPLIFSLHASYHPPMPSPAPLLDSNRYHYATRSTMSQHSMATLRRNHSTASTLKPPPPQRRPSSTLRDEHSPPPPPAPTSGGSNSSTPRGSMEHLPPPPPHLLQSDEEGDHAVISQRGLSVAESVKALQKSGHLPCSPKTLRRAHSVAGGQSPYQLQQQIQQQKQLQQPPKQEQIYAPVAHLQQKIHQRQLLQQQSPEGDKYGFGMQFHHHQSQFYHHNMQPPAGMATKPASDTTAATLLPIDEANTAPGLIIQGYVGYV